MEFNDFNDRHHRIHRQCGAKPCLRYPETSRDLTLALWANVTATSNERALSPAGTNAALVRKIATSRHPFASEDWSYLVMFSLDSRLCTHLCTLHVFLLNHDRPQNNNDFNVSLSVLRELPKRRQNYAHNFSGNFAGLKLIFAGVCCDVPAASSLRRLLRTREKNPFQPDVNQFKIQKNCNCATLRCFNTLSISPVCLPAMSRSLGFCAPKSGWSSTWETHGARKISWSQRRKMQCEIMRNCLKPEDMKDCQMCYTSLVCCWFSLRNLLCFTCPTQTHAFEQETRQMFGNDANSDFRTCQNPNVKHSRKTQLLKPFRTLSIKQIKQLKPLNR